VLLVRLPSGIPDRDDHAAIPVVQVTKNNFVDTRTNGRGDKQRQKSLSVPSESDAKANIVNPCTEKEHRN